MSSKFMFFDLATEAHTIPRNTFLIQKKYLKYYLPRKKINLLRISRLKKMVVTEKFMLRYFFSSETNRYVDHIIIYDHVCQKPP